MTNRKNIVYLYSEVMPYAISVMRELVKNFDVEIHCVYWDERKKTPFFPTNEHLVTFYKRSEFNETSLQKFIEGFDPPIIYVSGRMDKLYLKMALHFRQKNVKLVTASDNQWVGHWKQKVLAMFSKHLFRKYFEYVWIPGIRQYEFVRNLGYDNNNIIRNLYCADTSIFLRSYENGKAAKKQKYPHTIVFVGRFAEVKGIDVLIRAFTDAKKTVNNDWKLILVGSGNVKVEPTADIEVIDFLPNAELASKSQEWGVFCLPSYKEAWGVVVHEFAAAGLPIICADSVGASDVFVINTYNGYVFRTGNSDSLKNRILDLMSKSDEELFIMGERSNKMSLTIDPVKSAYSLISLMN